MATQLETHRAINKLLKERTEILKEHGAAMTAQVSASAGIQKVWEGASPKEVIDTINQLNEALTEAAQKFEESSAASETMEDRVTRAMKRGTVSIVSMKTLIDQVAKKSWPAMTAGALGFVNGLIAGSKFVFNSLKSIGGLVTSIAEGFLNVSLSIIAMPFRVLDGLVSVASKLAGLLQEIATAVEEVRKQFGELATGPSAAIIKSAKGVGTEFQKIGLGGYAIFGNLAERLRFVNQVATEMGAVFESFQSEFDDTSGAILLMQKGLGLTGEEMRGLAMRAKATGTTMTTQMKELTKFSLSFGKSFGVSSKLISRDMGQMVKDVKNFGNIAPKELATVSVYARKLGLDVKDLLGVIDKFDTFESAAESSAMLSQAFGVTVDAIKLMNAESPADRVEQLRQAFLSTGQSAEKFNRQELKYLSTITGLSEETAKAAFSQKNLGVSMNDLQKQGKVSEKQQLSTADAVQMLNTQIERMIKAFRPFTGFLQAFVDGFSRGVFMAKDMRELLTEIYHALQQTYRIGMVVGEAFVKIFPGISEITKSLKELFRVDKEGNPVGRFRKFLGNIKLIFIDFFQAIAGDDPKAVPALMKRMRSEFFSWLDLSGEGSKLYDSVKKFAAGFGNVVAGMIDVISDGVVQGSKILIDVLNGKGIPDIGGDGIISRFMKPIMKALERNWEPIKTAFLNLIKTAWEKAKPELLKIPWASEIVPVLAAAILGPAVIQSFIAFGATKLAGVIGKMIMTAVTSAGTGATAGTGASVLSGVGASIASVIFSPLVWVPLAIAAVGAAAVGVSKGMKNFRGVFDKEFKETESMLASATAGLVSTISFGFISSESAMSIGRAVGKMAETMLDGIRKIPLGDAIAENLQNVIKNVISFYSSLGDLISALWEGDSAKINQAFKNFGERAIGLIVTTVTDTLPLVQQAFVSVGLMAIAGLFKGLASIVTDVFPWLMKQLFNLAGGVFSFIGGAIGKLGEFVGKIPIIGGPLQAVIKLVGTLFELTGSLFTWIGKQFGDLLKYSDYIWKGMSGIFSGFADGVKNIASGISTWFSNLFSNEKGENFILSWIDGIDKGIRKITDVLVDAMDRAIIAVKDFLGISSPSKVFMEIGQLMIEGLLAGFQNMGQAITDGFKKSISGIAGAMSSTAEQGLSLFKGVWGINSPSTEAISIGSNITAGLMKSMNGMSADVEKVASRSLDNVVNTFTDSNVTRAFKDFTSPAVEVIKSMINEANAINEALSTVQSVNVKAKLKQLADSLGLKNEQFQIKSDKVNIAMNVDITIEADKLAKVLSEHGLVSSPTAK